jgi:hypothetical protein
MLYVPDTHFIWGDILLKDVSRLGKQEQISQILHTGEIQAEISRKFTGNFRKLEADIS